MSRSTVELCFLAVHGRFEANRVTLREILKGLKVSTEDRRALSAHLEICKMTQEDGNMRVFYGPDGPQGAVGGVFLLLVLTFDRGHCRRD